MSNSIELLMQVLCKVVHITFISSSLISVRQSYGSVPASEIAKSDVPDNVLWKVKRSSPSAVLTQLGKTISRVISVGGKSSGIIESRKSAGITLSIEIPLLKIFLKSLSWITSIYSFKFSSSILFFNKSIKLAEKG